MCNRPVPAALQELSGRGLDLTDDRKALLQDYGRLNDLGREEARKRVQELTEIEKYTDYGQVGGVSVQSGVA